jgi:hypothetical protein
LVPALCRISQVFPLLDFAFLRTMLVLALRVATRITFEAGFFAALRLGAGFLVGFFGAGRLAARFAAAFRFLAATEMA